VTILVNGAEAGDGIDLATAKSEYESAQAKTESATTKQEKIQAKQALKRARARFQAAGGMS
jgi:F-type H+-transporting ATPase subunit epsilon